MIPPDHVTEQDAAEVEVAAALRTIWERHYPAVLEQVGVLEGTAAALSEQRLDDEQREQASAIAHRLAGSLGTFGLGAASEHARRIELLLTGEQELGESQTTLLDAAVHALAEDVRAGASPLHQGAPSERTASVSGGAPVVLIVEDDAPLADSLALEAERMDLRTEIAISPAAARASLARARPDAILLDLTFEGGTDDALALLSEIGASDPPIPVLVSTVRDELSYRVEVARRGGRRFVTKAVPADEVIGQVIRLIEQARASEITILAVDDDPALLDAVQLLLSADGYRVITLSDPLPFWQELEQIQPDLVLLDIDMPQISGLELCRVLRNDPRWAAVPVLILTARRDAATLEQVFAAGADDHLVKPLLGPELRVRVRNRVERLRLHRALAETDGLTGIANRHTAAHSLERLIRLAARHEQPLSLAMLDLDNFKAVNDRHGHPAGDDVLRRLGRALLQTFRGEDVVGRWGGEEFIIGMYGISRLDAVARLTHLLNVFGEERFAGSGTAFRVGFSAGVACHPQDGTELDDLVETADAALYRAKEAGRGQIAVATSACSG